ncbi:uncharacterized protein DDB_G0284459-like [Macrobrachium rosenbergii]|uniref:uncharacterized protein DDB_G0284459-like n=1 Tax=Macrobrachium rosenbergii TaxID=79674 RepID=UPI0034D47124
MPDNLGISKFKLPSETPTSMPPSKIPSPHHPTSPMEPLTTPDTNSHVLGKNAKKTAKKNAGKCTKLTGKLVKDKSISQLQLKGSTLPSVPFPLGESLRLLDNVMAKELPSLPLKDSLYKFSLPTTHGKDIAESSEVNTLKDNSKVEWITNHFPWVKKESSPSPESILPDISCDSNLSNCGNICGDASCCPNDAETSLCPVTGILSPNISNLPNINNLNNDSFQEISQGNTSVKFEEFPASMKKDYTRRKRSNPTSASYLPELLRSDLSNTPRSLSPCSLSSSKSIPCSHSSCTPVQSLLESSNESKHPASTLLKLLESPILAPALSFNSHIFPQVNECNYQQSPLSTESDISPPAKDRLPENIEDSLQLVRQLICSVKIPPQPESLLKTDMRESVTRTPEKGANIPEGNDDVRSLLSLHKSREHEHEASKLVRESYMNYIQNNTNSYEIDSCADEQQSKGNIKLTKEYSMDNLLPSKQQTKNPCCCSNTKNAAGEKKQNQSQTTNVNQNEQDTLLTTTNSEADEKNKNSKSPPISLQEKCNEDATPSIKRPKITLKLRKRRFTDRGILKSKHTQRRMRTNSVSCHCCYNTMYRKRGLKKRSRIFSQKVINKETKPLASESERSGHSRCQNKEISESGNVDDILNEYSPSPNLQESAESGNVCTDHTQKINWKPKRPNNYKRRRLDSGNAEQVKKKGWRDIESLEFHVMDTWMTQEEKTNQDWNEKYAIGDSKDCSSEYVQDSTKLGRFHDLLKSESDSSDSEEDKLTIDLGH